MAYDGNHLINLRQLKSVMLDTKQEIEYAYLIDTLLDQEIAQFSSAKENVPVQELIVDIDLVQAGSGDPSPENVRPISGWTEANVYDEAEYDATATPKITIPFTVDSETQTIYGGVLNVLTGELTVTKKYLYMDGSVTVNSVAVAASGMYYTVVATGMTPGFNTTSTPTLWSSRFKPKSGVTVGVTGNTYITGAGKILVAVMDQNITTVPQANTWFTNNPTQFVYTLETPIKYQLTPHKLLTLLNQNNVWADTGNINTLTYLTEKGIRLMATDSEIDALLTELFPT